MTMPKEMDKAKAMGGTAGTVTRVTRFRATGMVSQSVSDAIRKGMRFETARA